MESLCEICNKDNNSHSFKKIDEINNISIFYTNPSKATKYYDHDGIIKHYELMLDYDSNKDWIWLFDSEDLELKHAMQLKVIYRFNYEEI